jgi:hypothetical protein
MMKYGRVGWVRFKTALSVLLVVVVCVGGWFVFAHYHVAEAPSVSDTSDTQNVPINGLSGAAPVRLVLPTVGIDTTFEGPLGLNPDQTIAVPTSYTEVGWYQYGPTPGELGPSVIVGHVDSVAGPAVFYRLGGLAVGDRFTVERADGSVAEFEVSELRRVDQDTFPTRDVYGDIDHAGIRLITCSGVYDRGELRYSHNLIVFGRLVTPENTEAVSL